MGLSWIFVVINVFLACDGFLLDDRTSPATTSGPLLSDQHYNFLINLIMNERQTRAKLEQHVVRLEQELLATEQGVTNIYHTSSINNATLEQQTKNWNALYVKYINLENENSLMKSNLNALRADHTNLENYTKMLEREVTSLRHLKGVIDLQAVLNVHNETNILREELKITNNSLNSVKNEAEARKQDFVALLNKAESTERKLEFSVKEMHNNIHNVSETLHYTQNQTTLEIKQMQREMQKYMLNQNQTFIHLKENLTAVEGSQNVSVEKLNLEIHNMSNRAAFTVCAIDKTYPSGSFILFPKVRTKYGVSNSALSTFGSSGSFKCEKTGLYLISGFVMTSTKSHARLAFYKNGEIIAFLYISIGEGTSYQTSSILTLQHLHMHDTIYVKPEYTVYVYGGTYSCISFLQLSN